MLRICQALGWMLPSDHKIQSSSKLRLNFLLVSRHYRWGTWDWQHVMQPSLSYSDTTLLRQTWHLTPLQDNRRFCGSCGGTGLQAFVGRYIPCSAAIQAPCSHCSLSDQLFQRQPQLKQPYMVCSMHLRKALYEPMVSWLQLHRHQSFSKQFAAPTAAETAIKQLEEKL